MSSVNCTASDILFHACSPYVCEVYRQGNNRPLEKKVHFLIREAYFRRHGWTLCTQAVSLVDKCFSAQGNIYVSPLIEKVILQALYAHGKKECLHSMCDIFKEARIEVLDSLREAGFFTQRQEKLLNDPSAIDTSRQWGNREYECVIWW